MSKIATIATGCEIHPYINNKYMKLLIKFDIKKYYNNFINETLVKKLNENNFKVPSTYEEFINKIRKNKKFASTIKNYYESTDVKLITDSNYESFYIVELKDTTPKNNYMISYLSKIASLNIFDMLTNYKDLFGNEIVFR